MTILEILEAHTVKRPWSEASRMRCKCGELVTAETEGQLYAMHRAHVAEVLDKHMQEREAALIGKTAAEGLDEHALEIAQQSSRNMPVSEGFKTMARHLVTTYELHRQAGTRAAPPVEPPGGEAMTTPGQKAHETALAKIREAAADNEAAPGMSQDYADGYANALDKITEILDSCTTQQDPTPAPLGADQKMKISAVRKAHKIETRRNIFTREEWLHCTCGWTTARVLAEGMNWETEKLLHIEDALAEE